MIQGQLGHIMGMKVMESPHVPQFKIVQFRFPKTKRKRIQKKWRKNRANFRQVKINQVIMFGNIIIGNPGLMDMIKEHENEVARICGLAR